MPFIWMPTVFCPKLVLWEVFRLLKAEAFMSLGQVRTSNFRDQRWGCRDGSKEAMRDLIRGIR